jgi:uncharacterized membrane protein YfcA
MSEPTILQNASRPEAIFITASLVIWILTAATTSILLWKAKTAEQKRSRFRKGMLFTGGTFLTFLCGMVVVAFPVETLFMIVPAIVVIGYLNFRLTHFCPKCLRQTQALKAEFCPHCGTRFHEQGSERDPAAA